MAGLQLTGLNSELGLILGDLSILRLERVAKALSLADLIRILVNDRWCNLWIGHRVTVALW